ncbi:hypothetical protein KY358_06225 [Candidatus Woesearchaeota archaeon]|nr:hypothetical protein [Candidatus Woesearchaeota archaeon]
MSFEKKGFLGSLIGKKLLVFLVAGLFMLVGCQQQAETTTSKAFIGGTNSIEFNFMEGSPPAEVYDGGSYPFEVTLNLENKGEYDVASGDITVDLVGFYPGDFGDPETVKNPDEDLDKAYIDSEGNTIPGTVTYMTFSDFSFLGTLSANNEYRIRANVCYIYGATAQADLCILDDLTKTQDAVCRVNEKKAVACSSSPVQVENFEETIGGTDKIIFSFDVVHRGTGLVSEQGTDCSEETIDKNKVWVEVDGGLDGLSCSGLSDGTETTGYTTLYGGKRKIRCTQDISAEALQGQDFEKKVYIDIIYDYKEHKETRLMVKHTT